MRPTVAVIGVGLIGGSLGQALKRSRHYRVIGIARRPATLRLARRFRAIDEGSTRLSAVSRADIIVLATPVDAILPTLQAIRPYLKPRAIITDVSSVKGLFDRKIRGVRFVGSHPLAGSHLTGVEAAKANLFEGATCVLVPKDRSALPAIRTLWQRTGARVVVMSAADHDAAVAFTSHLPHLMAHSLVRTAARQAQQSRLKPLMAGSFRDATRVACSDPEQWAQIFRCNAAAIRRAVRSFQKELSWLSSQLNQRTVRNVLKGSKSYRLPLFNDR